MIVSVSLLGLVALCLFDTVNTCALSKHMNICGGQQDNFQGYG